MIKHDPEVDSRPTARNSARRTCRFGAISVAVFVMLAALAGSCPAAATAGSVLEGNHPDEAADIAAEGVAAPSRPLAMHLTLALHDKAGMDRLLEAQRTAGSPEFHQWLTAKEFTRRFGPSDADIAKVTEWLRARGFAVKSADATNRLVTFTGNVKTAQDAFGVKIAATADGDFYANTTDPVVPAGLAPLIDRIGGLDNVLHSARMVRRGSEARPGAVSPDSIVNGIGPAFGPSDMYEFYDETPLLNTSIDGSNTDCLAVVEDSNLDRPAAEAFNSQFGLPAFTQSNFTTVLVNGTDPGINGDGIETMLDVNYSHATAPGSKIALYIGDPTGNPNSIIDALHKAVTDNICSAITVSFGFCGSNRKFYLAQDGFLAQAALQGQAVFVATGDEGAAGIIFKKKAKGCVAAKSRHVNELAASPNATAVGGTEFSATFDNAGNDVGSVPESVWNDSDGASGGGKSRIFKKPSFQAGLIPKDKKRDLPDISFAASITAPGFFFGGRDGGNNPAVLCCVGGTSVGAPVWAGISQLISQVKAARVGNLNSRLYQLGNASDAGIRDVTSGDNSFNGVKGFPAMPGYDQATGWGTPDISSFVDDF